LNAKKNNRAKTKKPARKAKARAGGWSKALRLEATLNAWAGQLRMEPRTVEKKLALAAIEVLPGKLYTAAQVIAALMGDKYHEEVRNLKADADRKEREEKEAKGLLVKMPDVEAMLSELFVVPFLTMLNSLGTTLDTRCNPTDPELARQAIQDHVERTMKPQLLSALSKLKS